LKFSGDYDSLADGIEKVLREDKTGKAMLEIVFFFHRLLSFDFSSQELAIIGELSQEPVYVKAFENGENPHTATAIAIWGECVGKQYKTAKSVNYMGAYGGTAYGLAAKLGVPPAEAEKIVDLQNRGMRTLAMWKERQKMIARRQGYIQNIYGLPVKVYHYYRMGNKYAGYADRTALNFPILGCHAPETFVSTNKGLIRFSKINDFYCDGVGIKIIDDKGNAVDFRWVDSGVQKCRRIIFDTNKEQISSENTLVTVFRGGSIQQVAVKDLVEGDLIPLLAREEEGQAVGSFKSEINKPGAHNITCQGDDEFFWYLFGYILGDGGAHRRKKSYKSAEINIDFNSEKDIEQLAYIEAGLKEHNIPYSKKLIRKNGITKKGRVYVPLYRINIYNAGLIAFYNYVFREDWVAKWEDTGKYIPDVAFTLMKSNRRAILRALCDSDGGWIVSDGGTELCFTSANYYLGGQVVELFESCGIQATVHNREYNERKSARVFVNDKREYMNKIGFVNENKGRIGESVQFRYIVPDAVVRTIVREFKDKKPLTWKYDRFKKCRKSNGSSIQTVISFLKKCYRAGIGKACDLTMLSHICSKFHVSSELLNYRWTSIKGLEDAGVRATHDVHLLNNSHLFRLGNGWIVHNCG
jgi:hypothetical protein